MAGDELDSADRSGVLERLDSWKEIAAYLKRDVTTVRRWEKREGLPVHRHLHERRDSVYAYKNEIDTWWAGRATTLSNARRLTGKRTARRTGAGAPARRLGCRRSPPAFDADAGFAAVGSHPGHVRWSRATLLDCPAARDGFRRGQRVA